MVIHIYIAACSEDGGIYHYTKNSDGSLTEIDFYPLDRPMYLAVKNGKMHVLLRSPFKNNEESGYISYTIRSDGSLTEPSEIISTMGEVACHLFVPSDENTVYCANYVTGSVFKSPSALVSHEGEGPSKPRQDKPHTHYVNETPDGKYIFVTDLGLDTIFTYSKDLKEISRAKVPEGHGVRHLAYSADGNTVFAANELASTVSAFEYDNGVLTIKDTVCCLPDDFHGETTLAAIRVKDGMIYASNRGHDSISCLEYTDGKLSLLSVIKTGGASPRDFDFVGDCIYSTNEMSNSVTVLKKSGKSLSLLPFSYSAQNPLSIVSIEI
ncbi:MAG: lactonase family protein [Clostridia bacterium]|nr:lactonase family protein [Clostridia bacterium]